MKILLALIVLIVAGWSAAWFALAAYIGGQTDDVISRLRTAGTDVTCADRATSGFPFAMKVTCDSVEFQSPQLVAPVAAGRMAAGIELPEPRRLTIDLASPIALGASSLRFDNAEAIIDVRTDGGFDLARFGMPSPTLAFGAITAKADMLSGEAQRNEADLTVSLRGNNVASTIPQIGNLAPATVWLFATLTDGYRDIVERGLSWREVLADGGKLNLRRLDLKTRDSGRLTIVGNIDLLPDGRLNGPVRIAVTDPDALRRWVQPLGPQAEQVVATLTQAVNGMGQARDFDGTSMRSIDVMLDNGALRLGFIKIADIPPLKLN
ncbi:DUF2125 domain-containing protein [Ahrensia sp. R2A130]|uniref:DUF2125 domain-containing protein n=1 Tax=Ahrensia sp. R2A130 TaxID=744979 RepID=UPI0001E0E8EA|nr:DUF2125 domain-containing protein [Ahrensia sp. R2A130]EFL88004.1 conserved hypothetical protein [Ahrensia sp. R2A130]